MAYLFTMAYKWPIVYTPRAQITDDKFRNNPMISFYTDFVSVYAMQTLIKKRGGGRVKKNHSSGGGGSATPNQPTSPRRRKFWQTQTFK